MELICTAKFGDCEVGDVRIVPDGSEFSVLYFRKNVPEPEPEEQPDKFAKGGIVKAPDKKADADKAPAKDDEKEEG